MNVPLAIAIVQPAQALPEEQIMQKLRVVPIFTITVIKGASGSRDFLWESGGTSPKSPTFTRGFIGIQDAQAFLKVFQKAKPKESKTARVDPVPLSAIYKMQLAAKKKAQNVGFLFVPTESQLKNALSILKEPYKRNVNYPVPLFLVTVKNNNQNVAIQKNDMTQMFFDKQEAQEWLNTVKKGNPKLATTAQITVESLQNVLGSLYKLNDPAQQQLVFVPSRENVAIVRKIQAEQAKPAKP